MTKLTDEVLMFYVDGTLDPSEREQVETLLASDPDARDRLEGLRMTGRVLAELMHRYGPGQAPKRIVDRVLPREDDKPGFVKHKKREHGLAWPAERLGALIHPTAVPALAIALILGIAAGWGTRGFGGRQATVWSDLVQVEDSRIRAEAPLKTALESLPSGKGAEFGEGDTRIKVDLTFRNEAREYCREYKIEVMPPTRYGGIACRDDSGEWSVLIQALLAPPGRPGAFVPAGSRGAPLDAAVVAIMDGDPLASADEAAVIAKGWRE